MRTNGWELRGLKFKFLLSHELSLWSYLSWFLMHFIPQMGYGNMNGCDLLGLIILCLHFHLMRDQSRYESKKIGEYQTHSTLLLWVKENLIWTHLHSAQVTVTWLWTSGGGPDHLVMDIMPEPQDRMNSGLQAPFYNSGSKTLFHCHKFLLLTAQSK